MERADSTAIRDAQKGDANKFANPELKKEIKINNSDPALLSQHHKHKLDLIIEEVRHLLKSDPD